MYSQDWTPIVLRKTVKQDANAAIRNGDAVKQTQLKKDTTQQKYNSTARKLEADLDKNLEEVPVIKLNILNPEMKTQLITFRNEKKYNQIQLAKLINEDVSIIKNLETGKVVNNVNVLQKINRILGTKLRFDK
jgi:ribosome-binding protein aMBF1 (putative translation factor)